MVSLHQITSSLASEYKAVRLRALQDTPSAFGSTYASESKFSDADWQQRAANLYTPRSIGYLAHYLDQYCGIAAAFLKEQPPTFVELVGMWVAPEHRRTAIGRLLVDAIESWARAAGAHTFQLMVTSSNLAAIAFYQRLGFAATGHTGPYPNDPAVIEYEMAKPIR